MKSLFGKQLALAGRLDNPERKFNHLIATVRSLLQYAAVGAFEKFDFQNVREDYVDQSHIVGLLRAPTDTSPIQILDKLIPNIRNLGWTGFCQGWFEVLPGFGEHNLVKRLNAWAAFRNNRPGHGVLDRTTVADNLPDMSSLVEHAIHVLSDALPIHVEGSTKYKLVHEFNEQRFPSTSLKMENGQIVVIRHIRERRGIWYVTYQTLETERSIEGRYELDNDSPLVNSKARGVFDFVSRKIYTEHDEWSPMILIPNRKTDLFKGREEEIEDLLDWYNDIDSRMCLIHGDGGIGKTTLVLEFLHDVMDYPHNVTGRQGSRIGYFPLIILFYSAKLTEWTPEGIRHYTGFAPLLSDAIRPLLSAVGAESSAREWYDCDNRQLIDKIGRILKEEAGLERKDLLLIIDNTETLARTGEEEKELHRRLEQISRTVGRVIVTSRRREALEARHIEVPRLDLDSSIQLLRDLTKGQVNHPLQKAGEKRLKQVAENLNRKPVLLEVVSRFLVHGGTIRSALDQIYQAAHGDLGEFLYQDAWDRVRQEHQNVFLVLSSLNVPINEITVGWTCRQLDVIHGDWLNDTFRETHFGQLDDYGTTYEIAFAQDAIRFFQSKKDCIDKSTNAKIKRIIKDIEHRYFQMKEGEHGYVSDRIYSAFRVSEARTAKFYALRGDHETAQKWYEEAIVKDSQNSALFDRYAFFLFRFMKKIDAARDKAARAISLAPDNKEALFTASMIEYEDSKNDIGDKFLERALQAGKEKHLCLIQKAKNRTMTADKRGRLNEQEWRNLQEEALQLFEEAEQCIPNDGYREKNEGECRTHIRNIRWRLESRAMRTSGAWIAPQRR